MIKYAKISNDETKVISIGTGTNHAFYESIGMTLMDVEQGYDGNWYVAGYAPKQPLEEQVEAAYKALDANVEKRLNDFAATRRYASIYTACNARDSQIAKYAAEGSYCFKMWGETYAKCEELLNEYMPAVLAGERPIPTWEEIEEQLPPLVWPNEE